MAAHSTVLYGFDLVVDVLQPLELVPWGELAVSHLGVPTGINSYMLGISDELMDEAEQKLIAAGFVRQYWSYCSTIDPVVFKDDTRWQQLQTAMETAYIKFDDSSKRFHYPDESRAVARTILLPASYIRLKIYNTSQIGYADPTPSLSQPPFYVEGNLHWPNVVMLIQSFLMVYEEEQNTPRLEYRASLTSWTFGYLMKELSLRHDILDSCRYPSLKAIFDTKNNRGQPRAPREKWNKPRAFITNSLIQDFQ